MWHIENEFSYGRVKIYLYERSLLGSSYANIEEGVIVFKHVEDGEAIAPLFELPIHMAQGLWEALADHMKLPKFAIDSQREDYLHERGRVDKLIEYITELE